MLVRMKFNEIVLRYGVVPVVLRPAAPGGRIENLKTLYLYWYCVEPRPVIREENFFESEFNIFL